MRGGKSFLVLLVLALAFGAYAYFVESKRDVSTDKTAKREKVFSIETGKIEEIEVKAAAGDVTRLTKNGSEWQIVAPQTMDADTSEASSLVSTLESLESQQVLEESPSSVAQYGVDPPRYSVAFRLTGEGNMRRLNVGKKTVTGSDLYARVEGQPKLFLISSYVEESLNRSTFDLREKSALKFARDGVDSLKLEPAGAPSMSLVKKGDAWRLTAPVEARADSGTVDSIVNKLSSAKMKALVTSEGTSAPTAPASSTGLSPADLKKYGLDKPQALVTVGAGSTRASLAVGGKKDDTTLYARDLSRPLVFTVESSLLDDLKKKPDDLRVKDVFEFRSFSAISVDITKSGQTYTLAKQKPKDQSTTVETWKLIKPTEKDVDQTKASDLLSDLSNLRAEKFADRPLASGDDLVIVAKFGDAAAPKEERVTLRKSGSVVHAIRQGDPGAAIVPTADFDKALKEFTELAGIK